MAEIISDLRDDLAMDLSFALARTDNPPRETPNDSELLRGIALADDALATIKRWCAKEPCNDNEAA
jgi:hypothetical protein